MSQPTATKSQLMLDIEAAVRAVEPNSSQEQSDRREVNDEDFTPKPVLKPNGTKAAGLVRFEAGTGRVIKVLPRNILSNENRGESSPQKRTIVVMDHNGEHRQEFHGVEIKGPSMLVYSEEIDNQAIGCGITRLGSVHIVTAAELVCYIKPRN